MGRGQSLTGGHTSTLGVNEGYTLGGSMNHRTVLYLTCLLWPALNFIPQLALGQSRDPEHYQLLVRDKVQIKGGAYVAGNVGVNSPEGSLKLSHDSVVADGRELVADKVRIQPPNARAFDVTRYLLPLAVPTNVGQVVSIRTLEKQISRLLSLPIAELRAVGEDLKRACATPPVNLWKLRNRERRDQRQGHVAGRNL